MQIKGSCHCGLVTYKMETKTPYPFNCCYCSICRKTNGGGGFTINIMADSATLSVAGKEHISI